MAKAADYAAVALDVDSIDDHRQPEFEVDAGVGRRWSDDGEQGALRMRIEELQELANAQG